jgi:hypothetical protein
LVDGEFPFEAEAALGARLGVSRDDGDEQGAVVDLFPDLRGPGVAAAEFVFLEPAIEARATKRLRAAASGGGIVAGVAEEDRLGGRVGKGMSEAQRSIAYASRSRFRRSGRGRLRTRR